ncbi:MAG TPA: NADH-quinone oxidoreductase subunit C [Verrucomicrobiae bacterium]|jgi:NADH-quinone oxidoreductase subunit C|nr:NADH-quinone oxidoreductase subunit C [Verrucomicrobiae bacterium]
MIALEELKSRIAAAVSGAQVEIIPNPSLANQPSILLDGPHARAVARFLRDEPDLAFDYASNVTGVDWPERVIKEKIKVKKETGGVVSETEETIERKTPACLEVVYHLYSMALRHGPLVVRLRTGDRQNDVALPSLTPVWRSCEFQEREVFDLFGVIFQGHHDLRRLLMWEGFKDHPMRKDYVAPDDYEYEPTPHDQTLERARRHYPQEAAQS